MLKEARKNELLGIESALVEHPFPPQIVIETTSYCNMTCVHCSHKELTRKKEHMDEKLFKKIVTEIANERPDAEVWPTFYGEALILGDRIWDWIDYAACVGCQNIILNSNGTLLNRKNHIERILRSPLKRFILSLDGFKAETFEGIRVGGKRDEIFASVEELLNRRARLNLKYPVVICQFSKMRQNEAEVEEFRAYWNARGAEVKVRPMVEWTRSGSIVAENIDHDTDFRIACPWGNNTMAIHQNGDVAACCVDFAGMFVAGNVKQMALKQCWDVLGKKLRAPHRSHDWGNMPPICRNCFDWQTAGAQYEAEVVENTRPFWFKKTGASNI